MKIETIELRKLSAAKGKVLTDGTNFGKIIHLSNTANIDEWNEISEEEYSKIISKTESEG